jgi:Cu(I)/Ag(I) efflux system membrane fusion protein
MYATVAIEASPREDVLHIPREALIRTGRSERVILALGEGRFRPAEVRSGIESGERVEILAGLAEGERVVTSSQFLIDSEASLNASFLRMLGVDETTEMSQHDHAQVAEPQESAAGRGTVKAVEGRMLTLAHDPISALGWPAMTMAFALDPGVDVDAIRVGDVVEFRLVKRPDGTFIITGIVPARHNDAEHRHD